MLDINEQTDANTLAGDIAQANLEYLPLKGNFDNLVEQTESISQIVVQINTFKVYPVFFWTIAAFFFSTLVVFAISYVINLTIKRPLQQLVQLTQRIAQGDTNARAVVAGHDETYMVATSMNIMLDSIVSLMKNIQQQHTFLEAHVQKLISEVQGLGSGDLRSRAEVTSDTLGFLAHSFNYIIDELSNLVVPVKTATNAVEASVIAAQEHLMELVQISTQQTQEIAEAVATAEQMTASALTIAEHFQALMTTLREIRLVCVSSQEEIYEVPQKMHQLTSLLDTTELQIRACDSTHTTLHQHLDHSRSILCALQNVMEADKKRNNSTHEITHNIEKLAYSVKILQSEVGTFKL